MAFRDNDSDYRDIRVSRAGSGAAGFEPAVPVTSRRWRFQGCPHDGPALAVSGERLHVLWMDASTGQRRLYLAGSSLSALQFSFRELVPQTPGEQGHPRLAARAGRLHAVWDNSQGESSTPAGGQDRHSHGWQPGSGRVILHSCSEDNGSTFSSAQALAPSAGAFQVNPAIAIGPDGAAHVGWNELTEDGKSVVHVRLPALSQH